MPLWHAYTFKRPIVPHYDSYFRYRRPRRRAVSTKEKLFEEAKYSQ
jgi:hypothetical protein